MFFISGITGKVGGAAARHLLEAGHTLRALVRDPQKAREWAQKGVEVRQGDLNNARDVAAALEGMEGAFLMIPPMLAPSPGFPEAEIVLAAYSEALQRLPPPRLVLLSSVGSQQSSGLGNITSTHMMEEALGNLPFPTAFVRAGAFIENHVPLLERAASTGWLDSFLQPVDRAFPMVATPDIGREIARLLVSGWNGEKIVELGSPLSPNDIAQAMSDVLQRPVQARPIPREAWPHVLEAMGLPKGHTIYFEEMEDGFNSGWIAFGVPGAEPVAGTTTPAQVFAAARPS